MKKMVMLVAGVAMAVVLTGCGGSKESSSDAEQEAAGSAASGKGVAERFVNAMLEGDADKALQCWHVSAKTDEEKDAAKAELGELMERKLRSLRSVFMDAKDAKDGKGDKYQGKAVIEIVTGDGSYTIEDGKKRTDTSRVTVQFVKGKNKRSEGLIVELVQIDGSWKVKDFEAADDLDTED